MKEDMGCNDVPLHKLELENSLSVLSLVTILVLILLPFNLGSY